MLRRGTLDTGICLWVNDGLINGQQPAATQRCYQGVFLGTWSNGKTER